MNALIDSIERATWFVRLGEFAAREGTIRIRSLRAWGDEDAEDPDAMVADQMVWLPSTLDTPDPVHGDALVSRLHSVGRVEDLRATTVDIHRRTLLSLRRMCDHALLTVGPHDFSPAARGAALFAMRHAAIELLAGAEGFWCATVPFYADGFWPCGVMSDGKLVVL